MQVISMNLRVFFMASLLMSGGSVAAQSTCFGTTANGKLEGACKLPVSGQNYSAYSAMLSMVGRTYVHCDVKAVLLDAYTALQNVNSTWMFVYGETGRKRGGMFKPHKTHQNGLSVDFMVPVINADGIPARFPANILNKYGYSIDFNLDGEFEGLFIDYEAFAAHLAALKQAAADHGVDIWRIIFDPKMQPALKGTKAWSQISDLQFSTRRSWVRHDEHYHVDFSIPCKAL